MSTRGYFGYKYEGKIRGIYNHSDSYVSGLGVSVLTKYMTHTQEELKDFLLNRFLGGDSPIDFWNTNWNTCHNLCIKEDGKEFYKNGLFCEYSYIFDLDAPVKTLLLFNGFGDRPSKGYENWCYQGIDGEKFYVHPGWYNLTGDYKNVSEASNLMYISLEASEEDVKTIEEISKGKYEDLPMLINKIEEIEDGRTGNIARKLLQSRLSAGK
jgi:hypothetical protein